MEISAKEYEKFQAYRVAEAERKSQRMSTQWVKWAREVGGDARNILRAYTMAVDLIAEHAPGWELRVGHARFQAGSATSRVGVAGLFSKPGVLVLSGPLMSLWDEAQQRQIILHEVAHAQTGPRHDRFWVMACHRLGIPALRCWGGDGEKKAPRRYWSASCPDCGREYKLSHKSGGRNYSCSVCHPGSYDERFHLTWVRMDPA